MKNRGYFSALLIALFVLAPSFAGANDEAPDFSQAFDFPKPVSTTVDCASDQYRTRECGVDGLIVMASVETQISRASCIKGSSWGTKMNSIWVSNGCRGIFNVTYFPL